MLKKILVGVLGVSVLGAGGAAVAYQSAAAANAAPLPAEVVQLDPQAQNQQQGQNQQQQQMSSLDNVGTPWEADGTIEALDDTGMTLAFADGTKAYVELGPPEFWQQQGVTLQVKQHVTVKGFSGDQGYHAQQVITDDGQILMVRNESGQPLWSGGIDSGNGSNGSQDGEHSPEPQAQVDEWVTLEGTIIMMTNGSMTIVLTDGTQVAFQSGQPRFFASQGVTFQLGDDVSVMGFYENDKFMAGDITQLATGLRVMLRDPNGRPLWAGPGGNGNGGGGNH